jgi:hypothetical protein
MHQKVNLETSDYFGVIYLLLPILAFFAFYTIPVVAAPSTVFLIYCISRLQLKKSSTPLNIPLLVVNAIISAAVVINSGAAGPLHVNTDWYKHYAVFNELARHSAIAEHSFTLRYYIGAYIIPSFAEKLFGFSNGVSFASWISLGLFAFLNQITSLTTSKLIKFTAPFFFLLFSGADLLGSYITGFQLGPANHIEWWAGWVEYSSPITSMFWSPQNTIPAWISIAFLIRRPSIEQTLFVSPLIFMSCLLWSPFAAVGIAPFLLLRLFQSGFKNADIKIIHLSIVAVLSAILCTYLTIDIESIPKHWIWNNPCLPYVPGRPCFTLSGYLLFITLEVLPVGAIALSSKASRNLIIYVSLVILVFLPLTQFGQANDLAMNASKPALAALIIGMFIALQEAGKLRKFAIAAVMVAGIATPLNEVMRGFSEKRYIETDGDIMGFVTKFPKYTKQYITPEKVWFLRSE